VITILELNKVYHGDCLEVMKDMENDSVDVTLTDIPYGVVNRSSNGLRDLDKGNADVFTLDMDEMLDEILRVTRGQIIIFCGREQFSNIYEFFANEKGTTRSIVWEKTNPSPMNGQYVYLSGVEFAVWFKPRGRKVFNAHCKNTVLRHSNGTRKVHPTQKNIELFKELILDNSNEDEVIFDPFLGSGTTAVAAINTNRNFIGIEKEWEYCEIANERIKEAIELKSKEGEKAVGIYE